MDVEGQGRCKREKAERRGGEACFSTGCELDVRRNREANGCVHFSMLLCAQCVRGTEDDYTWTCPFERQEGAGGPLSSFHFVGY